MQATHAEALSQTGELSSSERQELQWLRVENQALRIELEILRRAVAFFAKENDRR
jgi:transposase